MECYEFFNIFFSSWQLKIMNHLDSSPRNFETVDKTQKILALQDQLLNVRKEMSKKQSQWQKQRSNLLSKNEVANIQIAELKQRLTNLAKINETLSNAMTNQNESMLQQKSQAKIKKPKPLMLGQVSDFSCDETEPKKMLRFQQEMKKMNRLIAEKDYQISNLNKIGNQLRAKIEERNSINSSLQEACFNLKRKVEKKEEQILKLHKQIQELEQKLQQNNQYIDETRRMSCQASQAQISKRPLYPQDLEEGEQIRKYSKNSSYLMMKPTPDHSGYEVQNSSWNEINLSDPGYGSEEDQKLLCQVCNRVFSFVQFQEHVHTCGYKAKEANNTQILFDKKREIQNKLKKLMLEEQKENERGRYYKNEASRFDVDTSRDKILEIREIAKGLASNKGKKSPYNDFSIKSNFYY